MENVNPPSSIEQSGKRQGDDGGQLELELSLATKSHQKPLLYSRPINLLFLDDYTTPSNRVRRTQSAKLQRRSETIPAPYPWATTQRATVQSLESLLSQGFNTISGQVVCKRCDKIYDMELDLQQKFREVSAFISENKFAMNDRAPRVWMDPTLPDCRFCKESNCVKPTISKKRCTNWLFLLLGQLLGCCRLDQLKYFCKHTKNHRTGAKNRVLYLTYLALCKQLDPTGPFDA